MSEAAEGILILLGVTVVLAALSHLLIGKYLPASLVAALVSAAVFQILNFAHLGYIDPFLPVAVLVSAPLCFGLSLVVGLPFRSRRLARDKARPGQPGSEADIVRRMFSPEQREAALRELGRYGTEPHEKEAERVRLAILDLSRGNLDELTRLVEAAKKDYRDLLMWAENGERDEG